MMINERRGAWETYQDIHSGKGEALVWFHFKNVISPNMFFIDAVLKPGAYAGYHRHNGNEEIYYIVSGTGEYIQDGETIQVRPGDATLVKSGQSHGMKNTGTEDLRFLVFCGTTPDGRLGTEDFGIPDFAQHWKE